MIVAIPTVNGKLIARRFRQMTEFTFLSLEDGNLTGISTQKIPLPHHPEDGEKGLHKGNGKNHGRKQKIFDALEQSDELWFKALCKNWYERLSKRNVPMKRINEETMDDLKARLMGTNTEKE